MQPLHVVLVNIKSKSKPVKADALAQADSDGGGNTAEDRRAKTPLPAISDDQKFTPEMRIKSLADLEKEVKQMMSRVKSDRTVVIPEIKKQTVKTANSGDDLVKRSLEIARLEAQIDKNWDAYQKLPYRKHLGSSTKSFVAAQYIEDWRIKIERIGNLNYPEQARRNKIFGRLLLTVAINSDGSLANIDIARSSGQRILDAAAIRIVRLAAPFPPVPSEILDGHKDGVTITKTWSFTPSNKLESE